MSLPNTLGLHAKINRLKRPVCLCPALAPLAIGRAFLKSLTLGWSMSSLIQLHSQKDTCKIVCVFSLFQCAVFVLMQVIARQAMDFQKAPGLIVWAER